jgi:hypothetical protein
VWDSPGANPRRDFQQPTVRAFFQQFNERGIVRRVKRGKRCVLWAAADFATPDIEFGVRTLPSWPIASCASVGR